ncbi:hypothetical protein EPUS_08296 [Endocarpon pusillum Z07020]|uniref:ATPase expression protein 2, mitochondrial n=1 Tax=Endocarpon pusillum (strain Z07020 / HMAS-L-300199) TaxID=1263415 RepID=U1HVG6_ENDPU|nr:uncharacterized protein EPUS_08296 [Endocarpon pusillum Z07020]ERF73354.1 hypothetical protein EPUS_08296 [Endocarpon pusillum Z07020]
MRGSVPCLGGFTTFTQQSSSRIPHLKLHILARHPRSQSASIPERTPRMRQRCLHTTSSPFSLSGIFSGSNKNIDKTEGSTTSAISTHSSVVGQNVEVNSTLGDILEQAHPERVFYALLSTAEGRRFVAHAPSEDFEAAFCSIDPWYLIEPFKDIYRYIKPSLTTQPRYRWVRAIEERLESFAEQLKEIIDLRRDGYQLTKSVCTHLLHCARVLGHGPMARQIWQIMIPEDGLQQDLDVQAYNCYMEAICWANAFSKTEQWHLRVIPRVLAIRSSVDPPPGFSGHRAGPLGLRHETLVYFRRMVSQKIEGNEETFTNLMVAMGREADLAGAKSILKSVYNIDVDLLLQVDEEEVETPTFYELDSPLRPTARLLYTIAHVFGSNNEIELALKLVDFVSRQYDLRIPFNVWMHLFDWTFVLSRWRSTIQKRKGLGIGQLPPAIMDMLWTQMTDEPHNIKPDVVMHAYRAQSFRHHGLLRESLECIHLAKSLFEDGRGEAALHGRELLDLTDQLLERQPAYSQHVLPAEWFNLRRQFIFSSIIEDRDLQLLIHTIRTTFTWKRWPESRGIKEWERCRLPNLIADFAEYLPNSVAYRTRGGLVEIEGLRETRLEAARTGIAMSRRNGVLRAHMDQRIVTFAHLSEARKNFGAEMHENQRAGASLASQRVRRF